MQTGLGREPSSEDASAPCSPDPKEGEGAAGSESQQLHRAYERLLPAAAQSRAPWKQEVAAGVARGDVTAAPAAIGGGGGGGANRVWGAAA